VVDEHIRAREEPHRVGAPVVHLARPRSLQRATRSLDRGHSGRADLDLLAEAIRSGRLGRYLPTRLALSPHEQPRLPTGYRRVNVLNLLRQYRIPYRTRLEVLAVPEHPSAAEASSDTFDRKRGY